jgi:hypothetical protein
LKEKRTIFDRQGKMKRYVLTEKSTGVAVK